MSAQPRVFLVDDHELIRSGIRAEMAGHVEIAGEADEVGAAVEMILERSPDVVLIDVHMPDGGGRAVVRAALEAGSTSRFLALSVSDAAEDVISLIRAGARGYVTKNISGPDLVDAIYRIAAGDAVLRPGALVMVDVVHGAPYHLLGELVSVVRGPRHKVRIALRSS